MISLEQCADEVGVAMALPYEVAERVNNALSALPDASRVVGCLPGDNSEAGAVAGLLIRGARHRAGNFLVAPWCIEQEVGGTIMRARGVALWPRNEATQNIVYGGF